MSWFQWRKPRPDELYAKATQACDTWFHSFWKPTPHVIRTRIEVDLYVCGSARAILEQYKANNGDYPRDSNGVAFGENIGGLCAGNQIYIVSAFMPGGAIINPLTIGHEFLEYLDGRYRGIADAHSFDKEASY